MSSLTLPAGEIVQKPAIELNRGDILLGSEGGHLLIEDAYISEEHPNFVTVETAHMDNIYLDPNRGHTFRVLVPNA